MWLTGRGKTLCNRDGQIEEVTTEAVAKLVTSDRAVLPDHLVVLVDVVSTLLPTWLGCRGYLGSIPLARAVPFWRLARAILVRAGLKDKAPSLSIDNHGAVKAAHIDTRVRHFAPSQVSGWL